MTNEKLETHNRLASNRLASNRLASNRLASNRLASNRLASNSLALNANPDTDDILSTADGRDVYSYIVSCALEAGTTISADVPGAGTVGPPDYNYSCTNDHCTFGGALGLAPRWADHKLDNKGQGWVSACLLARVNANGEAESISLRGRSGALGVDGDELFLYTAEEGAFYGNVFDSAEAATDEEWLALNTNACSGVNNFVAHNQARDCATPDNSNPGLTLCGFNYAGDCRDFTPQFPNPYACRSFTGEPDGYYGDCHSVATSGKWPAGTKSREVITTYVAE